MELRHFYTSTGGVGGEAEWHLIAGHGKLRKIELMFGK